MIVLYVTGRCVWTTESIWFIICKRGENGWIGSVNDYNLCVEPKTPVYTIFPANLSIYESNLDRLHTPHLRDKYATWVLCYMPLKPNWANVFLNNYKLWINHHLGSGNTRAGVLLVLYHRLPLWQYSLHITKRKGKGIAIILRHLSAGPRAPRYARSSRRTVSL